MWTLCRLITIDTIFPMKFGPYFWAVLYVVADNNFASGFDGSFASSGFAAKTQFPDLTAMSFGTSLLRRVK